MLFLFLILILIAWDSNQRIGVGWHSEGRLAGFGLGWKLPVPSVVCLSSGNCSSPPFSPTLTALEEFVSPPLVTHSLTEPTEPEELPISRSYSLASLGFFGNTFIPLFSLNRPGVCCRSICSVIFHLITVDLSFSYKQDNAMEGFLCKGENSNSYSAIDACWVWGKHIHYLAGLLAIVS